jgi:hypothetical protein
MKPLNLFAAWYKNVRKLDDMTSDDPGTVLALEDIRDVAAKMRNAPKFLLPYNGMIFDTYAKHAADLKLPYDRFVMEFPREGAEQIVFVEQLEDNIIEISSSFWDFNRNAWTTALCVMRLEQFEPIRLKTIEGKPAYTGISTRAKVYGIPGGTEEEHVYEMIGMGVFSLISLVTALSCKNVVQTEIKPSKPKKGNKLCAKKDDTYRILEVTGKEYDLNGTEHSVGTPRREHLRRGHVRRLPKGNIWVQACVVNAGSKLGKVTKDYSIAKREAVCIK